MNLGAKTKQWRKAAFSLLPKLFTIHLFNNNNNSSSNNNNNNSTLKADIP
jgi:hypothetical protein